MSQRLALPPFQPAPRVYLEVSLKASLKVSLPVADLESTSKLPGAP